MFCTLTVVGSAMAAMLTAHTALNLRVLRRPPGADCPPPGDRISLLLPLRDEADRVEPCLRALLSVLDDLDPVGGGSRAELVICDDGSTDGTAELVTELTETDQRVRLLHGKPLPAQWLGKPYACAQLAAAANSASTVLVFVDADVILTPDAVRRAISLMRASGLDLVCPYPRQQVTGVAQRLVQPLLQWSWATTLPLRRAERSSRPSLAAANGQFLLVDRAVYDRAGGHGAVRGEVLEDIALLRAVKAVGGHGGVVDGTDIATCSMYPDAASMVAGYTKSLGTAFGPPPAAAAVSALLGLAYVVPALAMLTGSGVGAAGYLAGVTGRILVARRTDGRVWPDCLAHPVSIVAFTALLAKSARARRRGTASWRGRPVTPAPSP
jgi:hypothetical protein